MNETNPLNRVREKLPPSARDMSAQSATELSRAVADCLDHLDRRLKALEDRVDPDYWKARTGLEQLRKCRDDPLPYETTDGESGCARCHTVYQEAPTAPAKKGTRCRRCGKIAEPVVYLYDHWYCPRCDYIFVMTNTSRAGGDKEYRASAHDRPDEMIPDCMIGTPQGPCDGFRALQERHERLVEAALGLADASLRYSKASAAYGNGASATQSAWNSLTCKEDYLRTLLSQEPKP